jgi:hypothetical protein
MLLDTPLSLWRHKPYGRARDFHGQASLWFRDCRDSDLAGSPTIPPSDHPYKYRLVYVVDGQRVLGYDNERGKGDHKHVGKSEMPYNFVSPQQLMADFMADLEEDSHERTNS